MLQNPAGSYAEPWDDVQGDARQQRQQQPSPQRGGVDGGFFAGREVQPSPPVGPRPTEQRTPRSYGGGSQRSPGRGGTGMNLEDEMERVAAEKSQVSPNRLDHVHFARLRTAISRCAALLRARPPVDGVSSLGCAFDTAVPAVPQTLQKALAREDRAAATDLALLHQLTGDYKGAKSPNRTIVCLDLDDKPWYLSVLIVISLVWSLGKPELSLGCPLPLAVCARLLEMES